MLGRAKDNPRVPDGTVQKDHTDILILSGESWFLIANSDEAELTDVKSTKTRIKLATGLFAVTAARSFFFLA